VSARPQAGQILIVDWRGGALPREPSGLRPAVVIEADLLPIGYPNALVAPLTRDERLAWATFAERIDPTPENGCEQVCWALAHHVQSVSLTGCQTTGSQITAVQLESIRHRIGVVVGLLPA
jgi:mRNA interferase MazF